MGAQLLATPELELSDEEAKKLAVAVARVNDEFGGIVLSPKTQALLNLGTVSVGIYGPRVIAIGVNAKKKRAEKKAGKPPVTINAEDARIH